MSKVVIETFDSRDAAYDAAAEAVAEALRAGLRTKGYASLAGAGGSTPAPVYERLSAMPLAWDQVTAALVDERFVPNTAPDSNEKLLREHLLKDQAAKARFTPMYSDGAPSEAAAVASKTHAKLLPLDAVLLGMGEDGHFASLFPDNPALEEGLDLSSRKVVIAAPAGEPAPPQTRLTFTLAALAQSRSLVLLVTGAAKKAVVEAALDDPARYPIGAVFAQTKAPVRVLWAA
ncbi:6-phosphogluconolactonase [Caulobacter sp. NIBR2454]|uniref:6-phosphogluconolactonase n=1 Tax=Caulobacter sp. NIBR2454 TaxID=3015996 RepID=UPI0022B5E719|nr:6-phosphogluconolactonase [Caulobacter sp. NIBR2454]